MTVFRFSEQWYNADNTTHGTLSSTWVKLEFKFRAISVVIMNKTTNILQFSFDGSTVHGWIGQETLTINDKSISQIWVRAGSSTINSWQILAW